MKISIITVCYNSEKTIESTIKSVLSQMYYDIEYIIIDGGSADSTLNIIRKYQTLFKQRLLFISEPDYGLYDAMNKGIDMSTGELIGILNSDDTFFSDKVVDNIVTFHKKNNIDASIANIIQQNNRGETVRFYSSKNWEPNKLKLGYMPPHPSIFFRRELFSKYGKYILSLKIAADYELILRYFLIHKISWKYYNITTTSMLVGGLSSSGFSSYKLITKEISQALLMNGIANPTWKLNLRFVWKLYSILRVMYNRNIH